MSQLSNRWGRHVTHVFMLCPAADPLVILTSRASATALEVAQRLHAKGTDRFFAGESPKALARERYGHHVDGVRNDPHASDDRRVLDLNGARAFKLFRFDEVGAAVAHEGDSSVKTA